MGHKSLPVVPVVLMAAPAAMIHSDLAHDGERSALATTTIPSPL